MKEKRNICLGRAVSFLVFPWLDQFKVYRMILINKGWIDDKCRFFSKKNKGTRGYGRMNERVNKKRLFSLGVWREDLTHTDYLTFTYHFIDADWVRQNRLLYCAEYDSTLQKRPDLIHDFVFQKLTLFGLSEDICRNLHFVTGDASNMVSAFTGLKRSTCAGQQINQCLEGCFSRGGSTESFATMEAEPVYELVETGKRLVAHANQMDIVKRLDGRKLVQLVAACPRTTLDMMDSILEQYDVLEGVLESRGESDMLPRPKRLLEEFVDLMAPFREAAAAVGKDCEPTIHQVSRRCVFADKNKTKLVSLDIFVVKFHFFYLCPIFPK